MPPSLLFTPDSWMSAQVCESLPGIRSVLDELRTSMDVEVFSWPCTVKKKPPVKGDWQDALTAMETAIDEAAVRYGGPVNVLAMPDAAPIAIAALAGHDDSVSNFISVSLHFSNATLRALGMVTLVEYFNAAARTSEAAEQGSHARRFLRFAMDGASEDELNQAAAHVDASIDWQCWDAFFRSYHEEFDLMALATIPKVRTLYLDPPSKVYAAGEKRATFLKLFPHAEVAELKDWPARLQDASTGHELAQKVRSFCLQRPAGA